MTKKKIRKILGLKHLYIPNTEWEKRVFMLTKTHKNFTVYVINNNNRASKM